MKNIIKYGKYILVLVPFSLVGSGQSFRDESKEPIIRNVDTPNGGTELGNAILRYNKAVVNEEREKQLYDSVRIAHEAKLRLAQQ